MIFLEHLATCLDDVAQQVLYPHPECRFKVYRVEVLEHDLKDKTAFDVVGVVEISVVHSLRQKTQSTLYHAKQHIKVFLVSLDEILPKHQICVEARSQICQNPAIFLLKSRQQLVEVP